VHTRRIRVATLLALAALTATMAAAATSMAASAVPAKAPADAAGVPRFDRVFLIVGENTELRQINKNVTPYLATTLRHRSAWLTHYFAVTHFSLANYIAMTSGQYTACHQGDYPPADCHQDVDNLFAQLDDAGVSWKSWMESMPEQCAIEDAGSSKTLNGYDAKHNAALYYDGIEGPNGVWSATSTSAGCRAHVVPAGTTGPNDTRYLDGALASGRVPRFNLIVPNECENGHDSCLPNPPSATGQFDDFLEREVPKILVSPAFTADSVLIVTYDEGTSTAGGGGANGSTPCDAWVDCPNFFDGGGNVPFLVIGDPVRVGIYDDSVHDHYGLLRTLEDGFGIAQHLGRASTAHAIDEIWG
jgi:phosphatidylinositol-3-phosphatase